MEESMREHSEQFEKKSVVSIEKNGNTYCQ